MSDKGWRVNAHKLKNRRYKILKIVDAAMSQWIHRRLPFCLPRVLVPSAQTILFSFLKMHSRPLFLYFRLFTTQLTVNKIFDINKLMPMIGFEPRTSGIGSDLSTNWATTTSQLNFFHLKSNLNHICLWIVERAKISKKKVGGWPILLIRFL